MRPVTFDDVYRADVDSKNCTRVLIAAGPTKCRELFEVLVKQNICTVCTAKVVPGALRLLKCGDCRGAFYCKKKCQVQDWHLHKAICRSIISTKLTPRAAAEEPLREQEWVVVDTVV
jgi:hypothetical protein